MSNPNRWPTCKELGIDCRECGTAKRGCTQTPDGKRGHCHKTGQTWHASSGDAPRARENSSAGGDGKQKKSYASAIQAIEAAERWKQGKRVADGTYRDSSGGDVAKVVRLKLNEIDKKTGKPKKAYCPIHRHKTGWRISDPPGQWPIYRLDKLEASGRVYVLEGEKCADLAVGIGLNATTSAHGGSSASKTDWTPLAGRDVVILPDNDKPGQDYADGVARLLLSLDPPATVRIVKLPGLPDAGDIEQYIADGGTRQDIEKLVDDVEPLRAADRVGGPVLTCMADVEAKPIQWLWPGRIVMGAITLLNGYPGDGKSLVTIDLASRVTTGTPWPDGAPCEKGPVILITYEDDRAQVVKPRLDVHHADSHLVIHFDAVTRPDPKTGQLDEKMFTLVDLVALRQAVDRIRPRLVVIDPIGSAMGGDADAHRDNEVRGILSPVSKLAERYGVAVLVVSHRRKASGGRADDLALGSRAFTGIARAAWHVTPDKDDKLRRLFLAGKNNLGPPMDGLAFTIIDDCGTGKVVWEADPVTMSADDALALENQADEDTRPGPEPVTRNAAADWLRELLADGPMESSKVRAEAGAAGYSWTTLRRAKDDLGIRPHKERFAGVWLWRLPSEKQLEHLALKKNNLSNLSTFVKSNEKADISRGQDAQDTEDAQVILPEHLGGDESRADLPDPAPGDLFPSSDQDRIGLPDIEREGGEL